MAMEISVPLENGLLPDRFGKFASAEYQVKGHPCRSFPISVNSVPEGAQTLALTFVDFDSIPVCGFCWIHWLACNFPVVELIPEDASATEELPCVQGSNSDWSPWAGGHSARISQRYAGPYPPDKTHIYTLTVYALDCALDLGEGYLLNEFRRAIKGHVLAKATLELPSRAS